MKKITIFGFVLALGAAFTSCSDAFLNVSPPTDIGQSDFYKTENDITQALVAAYAPLQWEQYSWGWGHSILVADILADDLTSGGGGAGDNAYLQTLDNFSGPIGHFATDGGLGRFWLIGYSGIYRCNQVTDNIANIEGIDPKVAARIEAEAIFLRNWYYFLVWRFWGNIPYYEANLLPPYVADQLSADQVYENAVWGEKGLDAIIKSRALPETLPTDELGRITQAAAQMLKARWVMLQNDTARFPSVLADMQDIINKGHHALKTSVVEDYTKPVGASPAMTYIPSPFEALYMQEGEFCSETIFDYNHVDYGSTENWGSPYEAGGTVYPQMQGPRGLGQNNEFGDSWGFGAVPPATYAIYDDADTRKDGGIINLPKWAAAHEAATGQKVTYSGHWNEEGFFFNKKYINRKGYNVRGPGSGAEVMAFKNNLRIFRYAETLLNAAELLLRTNGSTTEAQKYLDIVRDRAYDVANGGTAPALAATIDNIMLERRKEFFGDGIRYWDLVRTGQAEAVLGPKGWKSNATTNGVKRWWWPIPESEINRSASTTKPLTQNP